MSDERIKPAVSMAEIKPELERLHRRGFLRSMTPLGQKRRFDRRSINSGLPR
jgi:hypothetical protein